MVYGSYQKSWNLGTTGTATTCFYPVDILRRIFLFSGVRIPLLCFDGELVRNRNQSMKKFSDKGYGFHHIPLTEDM